MFLKLATVAAVACAAAILYLHVEISRSFEGRVWDFPSRIYSDRLVLAPGVAVGPAALSRRLDRCGYARVESAPRSPGQYRLRGGAMDVHLRAFEGGPFGAIPSRRIRVRFGGEAVAGLEDSRGARLARAEVEPEVIALLAGPHQEERETVALAQVPASLVSAVLAAEDSRFFAHPGVDLLAVFRAAFANVRSARIVQGGSTITQQTVKNLYLGQERTWWRKLREVVMALLLDLRYPKDRILEVYLNEVYLGQQGPVAICGVGTASRHYFGRDLKDLTLGEHALLAGLIRSPGAFNPFLHPDRAVSRRDQVLAAMVEQGSVSPAEAEKARAERLRLAGGTQRHSRAPWVADFVRAQLSELYSPDVLSREGLRIHTTIDTVLQEGADAALGLGLTRLEQARQGRDGGKRLEGCIVALEPRTGTVLAMVGGRNYAESQFNRAVQARRQPGSCFKPFVYLAGLEAAIEGDEAGLTPATVLDDSPIAVPAGGRTWRPENYDGSFRGRVTARRALEESLNVPTVSAALRVGLRRVARTAERCGFPKLAVLPSMCLGAQEITPLELAAAYGTIAGGGRRPVPFLVREVRTRDGTRLERRRVETVQAVSPQAAWLVTDMMRGVLLRGTAASASALGFHGDAAGKTGTTDDTRDAWFVGFNPDVLALVWVGYDDGSKTRLTGASGALPIWVDFMTRTGRSASRGFAEPEGIAHVTIDPESGMLAVSGCPTTVDEVFASGTEPEEECPLHGGGPWDWLKRIFRRRR